MPKIKATGTPARRLVPATDRKNCYNVPSNPVAMRLGKDAAQAGTERSRLEHP